MTGHATRSRARDSSDEPVRDGGEDSRRGAGRKVGTAGTIASALFYLVLIAVAVWQFAGVSSDGSQIQVLNPDLGLLWRVLIVAVLAIDVVLVLRVGRLGRWSPRLAVVNIVANGIGAVVTVVPLIRGDLLMDNVPQQLAGIFDENVTWSMPIGSIAAFLIVLAIWDSVDGACKAGLGRRRNT